MSGAVAPGAGGGPAVFEPARLGPLTLKNRIIKAATFEGAAPKGVVSDQLIDFHRRMASGGVAMTTVAYLAVSPEGRTDRHCVLLGADSLPGLRRLTDAVHETGAAVSAQIGHAGPVANARSNGAPSLAPSRRFSPSGSITRAATEEDIARITEQYRAGALVAVEAGFDCIEIHLGPQLSAQRLPEPQAQPSHRPLGRKLWPTGPAFPARWSAPCGKRWGTGWR